MVAKAKRCMAGQAQPNEVDRSLIEFMEEMMRMKTEREDSDREECTREDLKVEPISEDEQQNDQDDDSQYISLKDIEVSLGFTQRYNKITKCIILKSYLCEVILTRTSSELKVALCIKLLTTIS